MTKHQLQNAFKACLLTLDDDEFYEWYDSDRGIASVQLDLFMAWLQVNRRKFK